MNERLLAQVNAVVDRARNQGLVTGELSASDLCRIPHVLEVRTADAPDGISEGTAALVELVLSDALDALVSGDACDTVVAAIVGAAGLSSTLAAAMRGVTPVLSAASLAAPSPSSRRTVSALP